MARIEIITEIGAPIEIVFDRARDLDLHTDSLAHTNERIVAGRTSGLIEMDEEVTFRARHFGISHEHTSRITAFDRPQYFRDEMIRGRFKYFKHDHFFAESGSGTRMTDVILFNSPLGFLGRLVDRVFLAGYLERLIRHRNQAIKEAVESRAAV